MVRWMDPSSAEASQPTLAGVFTRQVEVTPEKVARVAGQLVSDFASGMSATELSEKYGLPVDNIFGFSDSILTLGSIINVFDTEEMARMQEIDSDILKTVFTLAFMIGVTTCAAE